VNAECPQIGGKADAFLLPAAWSRSLILGWERLGGFCILSTPRRSANDLVRAAHSRSKRLTGDALMDDVMSNAAYYRSREEDERPLANQASIEDIGKIHLELAERYAKLAEQLETQLRSSPSILT
jgi:hypothetical protein